MSSLDILRRFYSIQLRGQMQYRASFLIDLVSTGLITTLGFAAIALVFQRFDNLAGWSLVEIAFLYGMVETSFGLMDMLFSGFDPPNFGQLVRLGGFDQLLLRPLSITLQVLGSRLIIRRIGRVIQGLVILLVALEWLNVSWTPLKLLYLPVVLASLVVFFGGLFIAGAAFSFWTIDGIEVVNIFTYGGSEMMSYPMHIYQDWMKRFFTFVLPAILINYYPALYFLDRPELLALPWFAPFLAPLASAAVLAAGYAFWRYAIRHYQSTGT